MEPVNIENSDIYTDNELIEELEDILKIKEIHDTIDEHRYSSLHLKLMLSKILLDYFKGNVREVKKFLSNYNHHLTKLSELI